MTREEALNKAIGVLTYNQVNFCKSKEAFANMNEIIEALEKIDQEPNYNSVKTELEPCDDAVSKQAVLDTLTKTSGIRGDALKALYDLPSVSPQPKMGHWEWVQYDSNPNIGNWHCSECRTIIPHMPEETDNTPIYKWCPYCGAKMEGSD